MASENSSSTHNTETATLRPPTTLTLSRHLSSSSLPLKTSWSWFSLKWFVSPLLPKIWNKLHVYHAQSRANVKSLKIQFRTPKKDRNTATYLLDIKKIVDTQTAIGSPISTEVHVEAILDGLLFLKTMTVSSLPFSPAQILTPLSSCSCRKKSVLKNTKLLLSSTTLSSLVPTTPIEIKVLNPTSETNLQTKTTPLSRINNIKNAPRSSWQQQKPQFQIFKKFSHTATNCWHRFEHDFQPSISANQCQLSSSEIHDDAPSILGTPCTLNDPLWYLDSAATHRITYDSNNFSTKGSYNGNDSVTLGEGRWMSISHIGSTTFYSPRKNTVVFKKSFACSL